MTLKSTSSSHQKIKKQIKKNMETKKRKREEYYINEEELKKIREKRWNTNRLNKQRTKILSNLYMSKEEAEIEEYETEKLLLSI